MKRNNALCAFASIAVLVSPLCVFPVFADEVDDLFTDTTALDVAETKTVDNPVSELAPVNKFQWAGDFSGTGGSQIRYGDQVGKIKDLTDFNENLLLSLKARLWFDARPEDRFRVFGKFVTEYPFEKEAATPAIVSASAQKAGAETTTEVPNVKVFELFSDFDWKEKVFFRFGKQNTGWGVSRFYQIGDPLSVGVKDPTDPAADLEGPLALKATVPFGLNSIVFVSAVKNSYLPENDANNASIRDVGYGAKADIYVKMPDNKIVGNGQFTLGAYGQRRLAPKVVASYSTSVQKFQVFTDQVMSFGLDSYRLSNDEVQYGTTTLRETEKPWRKPFYSATLGTMYVDSVNHFTLYAEYLFNGAGSMKKSEYRDLVARFAAEQTALAINPLAPAVPATLSASDIGGYYGMHNSAVSLSFTDLFNNADLGFSATWLQNWIDLSGMVKPALTWEPIKHVVLEGGAMLAYGDDNTEWVLKTSTASGEAARTAGYLAVKLTNVKF